MNKTSGVVRICGHDVVTDMRSARRSLGVVPQELMLDTFFTVRQALDINAGYYGVPKAERRTQEIIDAMGLADKADINSRRLSGGMRRRLLIAKALVHNPDVLILDEPTAGVDVELRTQLWDYVNDLNKKGTTILLTTHYLEEAEELCDTIAVINHGQLVACDSKANLLSSFDSKHITITPAEPLGELPVSLQKYSASVDEGKLLVHYKPSTDNMQELLNAVQEAGVSVQDITTSEAGLEDIFLHLTSKAA